MTRRSRIASLLIALAAGLASKAGAAPSPWQPIDPADQALTTARVEPGADAEGIFWQVKVEDTIAGEVPYTSFSHYVRMKVFTQAGVESWSRLDLPYSDDKSTIDEVSARTVLPDGRSFEVKPSDIYRRVIAKRGGRKERVQSFVLPSVEPGAILEYRWRESWHHKTSEGLRLAFHTKLAYQRVTYDIKPLSFPWEAGLTMRTSFFNGVPTPFENRPDGFFRTTMTNVASVPDEPDMPPKDAVGPWMLLWYDERGTVTPNVYWQRIGKRLYDLGAREFKSSKELKQAAASITAGARTPEEKLHLLYDFCRSKVRNLEDDASGISAEDRAQLKDAATANATYEKREGTGFDVDRLFGGLAASSGLDTRIVLLGDRTEAPFDPKVMSAYLLHQECVAVKVGDTWQYFDPAATLIPFGSLPWWIEGTAALLPDAEHPQLVVTGTAPSSQNRWRRSGVMQLAADGTLEGDCRIEASGHVSESIKEENDDLSQTERFESLRHLLEKELGAGEYTQLVADSLSDPTRPFALSFHAKIAGYAQRTGKRLFLQPGLFERARSARFSSSRRRFPVSLEYPWSEDDSLMIQLPQGFAIESAQPPPDLTFGNFGRQSFLLQASDDGSRMIVRRSFHFDRLNFDLEEYPQLRQDFEKLHQNDGYTITLLSGGS